MKRKICRYLVCYLVSILSLNISRASAPDDSQAAKANEDNIVEGYQKTPNIDDYNVILAAAIIYANREQYPEAEKAFQKYLLKFPNDARANRDMGQIWLFQKKNDCGAGYFKIGFEQGDIKSLAGLACAYIATDKTESFRKLIPELLKNKKSDNNITQSLVYFALAQKPPDKELFYQSVDGLNAADLSENANLYDLVYKGFKLFGDEQSLNQMIIETKKAHANAGI